MKDKHEAIRFARQAFKSDRVLFSSHARKQSLPDDDVTVDDVYHALDNAFDGVQEGPRKWKTYGPILNGDDYAVVWEEQTGRTLFVITGHYPP